MNDWPPPPESGHVADGGFDSEDAVRDHLADSYVFELTYRTDGSDERTHLVTHETVDRPSAAPIHGPPDFRFSVLGHDETITVRIPDIVSLTPVSLSMLAASRREAAVSSMANDVTDGPPVVSLSDVETTLQLAVNHREIRREHHVLAFNTIQSDVFDDPLTVLGEYLFRLLDRSDTAGGKLVLTAIAQYADDEPDMVGSYTSELRSLLTTSSYTPNVVKCLATLAEDDPSRVIDTVPALATTAESGDTEVQKWVMYTFSKIAATHQEELFPVIDTFSEALVNDDHNLQLNALSALGHITSAYPDAATPVVDDLAELLTSEHAPVRGNAVGVLADVAQEHPDLVIDHATAIADLLTDDAVDTRRNAAITLVRAGRADPPAVKSEHEALRAALDDPDGGVRANACTLIGNTNAPVSADRLRDLRDNDPDERVQEQAAWALDRIE